MLLPYCYSLSLSVVLMVWLITLMHQGIHAVWRSCVLLAFLICLLLLKLLFFLLLPFSCKVCLQKTGVLHWIHVANEADVWTRALNNSTPKIMAENILVPWSDLISGIKQYLICSMRYVGLKLSDKCWNIWTHKLAPINLSNTLVQWTCAIFQNGELLMV